MLWTALTAAMPSISNHSQLKSALHIDHYFANLAADPATVVELSQYWYGLFSHRRDRIWKGMLRIELNTPADYAQARALLTAGTKQLQVSP